MKRAEQKPSEYLHVVPGLFDQVSWCWSKASCSLHLQLSQHPLHLFSQLFWAGRSFILSVSLIAPSGLSDFSEQCVIPLHHPVIPTRLYPPLFLTLFFIVKSLIAASAQSPTLLLLITFFFICTLPVGGSEGTALYPNCVSNTHINSLRFKLEFLPQLNCMSLEKPHSAKQDFTHSYFWITWISTKDPGRTVHMSVSWVCSHDSRGSRVRK